MTSVWRTFFSAILLASVAAAATVSGTIRLADSRDPEVRKGNDFSGVAVWLERADGSRIPVAPRTAKMVQKNKTFIPHVLAVSAGSSVDFPNFDPIFHNAFSNFAGQPFDVGLYPPGTSQKVTFHREGVVRVFCNIHPTMSAVIVVVPTPYSTVSARSGAWSIEGVPPGAYKLKVFHERAPAKTLDALVRTVEVAEGPLTVPVLQISESGYLQTPHTNKYGKEYPPVIEDPVPYSVKRP